MYNSFAFRVTQSHWQGLKEFADSYFTDKFWLYMKSLWLFLLVLPPVNSIYKIPCTVMDKRKKAEELIKFYIYGSVHRWYILKIVQREATQSSLFIILQFHSNVAKLGHVGGSSCTIHMTSTGGCSYSFVYSRWWVWLTRETCWVNLR